MMGPHFLADGLEIRHHSKSGRGVFATRTFQPGELLAVWGGWIISTAELKRLTDKERTFAVQVEEELYLWTPKSRVKGADFINHSCEPNTGLASSITLVAMKAIVPGEEVCYDYAMTDSHPDLGFHCECGSETCRHEVTGEDWRLPELRQRYHGFFSPYLMRKIVADQTVPMVEVPAVAADEPLPFVAFRKRARRAPDTVKLVRAG